MFRKELFVFAVVLASAYSQVIGVGECPKVDIVKDFDASKYVGKWYEIERYPLIWEFLGKCVTAQYWAIDEDTIGVYNVQINSLLGTTQSINGSATYDGPHSEAKLTVTFPGILGTTMRGSYWVLGTDYENYSVVYSCSNIGKVTLASAWILAREPKPSSDIIDKAYAILDDNKVNRSHFSRTDQENCSE